MNRADKSDHQDSRSGDCVGRLTATSVDSASGGASVVKDVLEMIKALEDTKIVGPYCCAYRGVGCFIVDHVTVAGGMWLSIQPDVIYGGRATSQDAGIVVVPA